MTDMNDIRRRASEIAGAVWDDRDEVGALADQLNTVAQTPSLGSNGDLSTKDLADLVALAVEAETVRE